MDGRRAREWRWRGGWGGGQEKKVSHQKNLISHSDTHENWGRKVGGGVGGRRRVMDVSKSVCVCVCEGVCVCAKGIHFQLFHHTSQSTDMLVCLFFCICVQVFCFFYPHF